MRSEKYPIIRKDTRAISVWWDMCLSLWWLILHAISVAMHSTTYAHQKAYYTSKASYFRLKFEYALHREHTYWNNKVELFIYAQITIFRRPKEGRWKRYFYVHKYIDVNEKKSKQTIWNVVIIFSGKRSEFETFSTHWSWIELQKMMISSADKQKLPWIQNMQNKNISISFTDHSIIFISFALLLSHVLETIQSGLERQHSNTNQFRQASIETTGFRNHSFDSDSFLGSNRMP